jgi:hypothetical protein
MDMAGGLPWRFGAWVRRLALVVKAAGFVLGRLHRMAIDATQIKCDFEINGPTVSIPFQERVLNVSPEACLPGNTGNLRRSGATK